MALFCNIRFQTSRRRKKLRGISAGYILKLDLGQLDFAIYFTKEGGNNQSQKIAYSSDRIVVNGHQFLLVANKDLL